MSADAIHLPDPAAEPDAYRAALLASSTEADSLEILAITPQRLIDLLTGRGPEDLDRSPGRGEWSATEIVGHLLDDEVIFAFRLRMALTLDEATYPGTDPDGWAALPKPPVAQLLSAFAALREYNVWMLRGIPKTDWNRTAVHAEQGRESVELNIRKTAGHDLAHLNQLERVLGAR